MKKKIGSSKPIKKYELAGEVLDKGKKKRKAGKVKAQPPASFARPAMMGIGPMGSMYAAPKFDAFLSAPIIPEAAPKMLAPKAVPKMPVTTGGPLWNGYLSTPKIGGLKKGGSVKMKMGGSIKKSSKKK